MAAAFAFLGMLLMSLLVGELAALALGDFFGANDEFVLVLGGVAAYAALSITTLALAYRFARQAALLNGVALLLAVLALVAVSVPGLVRWIASHSNNPYSVGTENTSIAIELLVPSLLAVLVQWGLVRRRWLESAGADELTAWPWVVTVLATFILLSPFGLALLQVTLRQTGGDFMWPFAASIAAGVLAGLVVMAAVECYIRKRIRRRRQAAEMPVPLGATGAQA